MQPEPRMQPEPQRKTNLMQTTASMPKSAEAFTTDGGDLAVDSIPADSIPADLITADSIPADSIALETTGPIEIVPQLGWLDGLLATVSLLILFAFLTSLFKWISLIRKGKRPFGDDPLVAPVSRPRPYWNAIHFVMFYGFVILFSVALTGLAGALGYVDLDQLRQQASGEITGTTVSESEAAQTEASAPNAESTSSLAVVELALNQPANAEASDGVDIDRVDRDRADTEEKVAESKDADSEKDNADQPSNNELAANESDANEPDAKDSTSDDTTSDDMTSDAAASVITVPQLLISSTAMLASTLACILVLRIRRPTVQHLPGVETYGHEQPVFGFVPTRNLIRLGLIGAWLILPPTMLMMGAVSALQEYSHPVLDALQPAEEGESPNYAIFAALFFTTAIVTPLVEEFWFRGLLQGGLQRLADAKTDAMKWGLFGAAQAGIDAGQGRAVTRRSEPEPIADPATRTDWTPTAIWPMVVASLLFAVMHWGQGLAPIPLFFLSLGLGYLYRQTGSLVPPIVVHFVLNGFTMSATFLEMLK